MTAGGPKTNFGLTGGLADIEYSWAMNLCIGGRPPDGNFGTCRDLDAMTSVMEQRHHQSRCSGKLKKFRL
jgi:hypothetical protein